MSIDTIETVADRIERTLSERGEKEIPASVIGETLMRELHDIDQVAYVRFASVYRSFKDIGEFMAELEDLIKERKLHPDGAGRRRQAKKRALTLTEPSGRDADRRFMRMACRLALKAAGRTTPNPMVGAVLVRGGRVIATGYHKAAGTDHAEIVASNGPARKPAGRRSTSTWSLAAISGARRRAAARL